MDIDIKKLGECPECHRQARIRSDGSRICAGCGLDTRSKERSKRGRCPNCGRKGRQRVDGSIVCVGCGFDNKNTKEYSNRLRCLQCNRIIVYLRNDGTGKCSVCGIVPKEDIDKQRETVKQGVTE